MNLSEQIKEKTLALEQALLSSHPSMPSLLKDIWLTLKANPDQVTLLSEEDIGIVVRGLKQQTKTEISTTALKTKGKSLKNISLDDL